MAAQTLLCDYSFARPSLASIKAAGYVGVVRYLCEQPNNKDIDSLDPNEAKEILAAGLSLTLVWEGVAQEAQAGHAAGVAHATEALRQAALFGWPSDRPIYFVLEDPTKEPASDWPAIEAYCAGLVGVLGLARVGGYGSQALLEHLIGAKAITYGWQVGGWSASVSAVCHLYQRLATTIAPASIKGSIDEDAALQADYGGWDGAPIETSAPAATTIAVPTPEEAMSKLNANIVAVCLRPQNDGYWLIGEDGGTFSFGAAPQLPDPEVGKLSGDSVITCAVATQSGQGLLLAGADGGVYALGDAKFFSSMPGIGFGPSGQPVNA